MKNGLVVYADGTKRWYLNDKLHREDTPAVEFINGNKGWFQNGELHRLDGPAIEWSDGDKGWSIEGTEYTEEDFKAKVLEIGLEKLGL